MNFPFLTMKESWFDIGISRFNFFIVLETESPLAIAVRKIVRFRCAFFEIVFSMFYLVKINIMWFFIKLLFILFSSLEKCNLFKFENIISVRWLTNASWIAISHQVGCLILFLEYVYILTFFCRNSKVLITLFLTK